MRTVRMLGHEDAERAIAAVRAEAARRGRAAVVAVADAHGETVGLLRMDGAPLASTQIAQNKAFTASRERKPSREVGRTSRDPVGGFDIAYLGDPRFIGWGGGLPVVVNGTVVGAVAVSGLTEDEDEELAALGIAAIGA